MAIDPMTLMMLANAGGSIGSAIAGGRAGNQAAAYNYATDMANLARADRADLRAQIAARLQRGRDERGTTDAAGNRVYYDPARGWVTELSPDQQALQTATTGAQQYNLTQGEAMRREGIERGAGAQRGENQAANALLEQFTRRARTDPTALANQIYAAGEAGRTAAEDRIGELAATQMVRQGSTSNAADILSARAREGSRASEEARRQAAIQAPDIAAARDANTAANTSSLYNMFRTRATNPAGTPFQPVSPTGPGRPNTGMTDAALINAMGRRPAQASFIQPNYSTANALATAGQGIGSALQNQMLMRQLQQGNERLRAQDRLLGNQ